MTGKHLSVSARYLSGNAIYAPTLSWKNADTSEGAKSARSSRSGHPWRNADMLTDAGFGRWLSLAIGRWLHQKNYWDLQTFSEVARPLVRFQLLSAFTLIAAVGVFDLVTRKRLFPAFAIAVASSRCCGSLPCGSTFNHSGMHALRIIGHRDTPRNLERPLGGERGSFGPVRSLRTVGELSVYSGSARSGSVCSLSKLLFEICNFLQDRCGLVLFVQTGGRARQYDFDNAVSQAVIE
jgi:hypothetical protein